MVTVVRTNDSLVDAAPKNKRCNRPSFLTSLLGTCPGNRHFAQCKHHSTSSSQSRCSCAPAAPKAQSSAQVQNDKLWRRYASDQTGQFEFQGFTTCEGTKIKAKPESASGKVSSSPFARTARDSHASSVEGGKARRSRARRKARCSSEVCGIIDAWEW